MTNNKSEITIQERVKCLNSLNYTSAQNCTKLLLHENTIARADNFARVNFTFLIFISFVNLFFNYYFFVLLLTPNPYSRSVSFFFFSFNFFLLPLLFLTLPSVDSFSFFLLNNFQCDFFCLFFFVFFTLVQKCNSCKNDPWC